MFNLSDSLRVAPLLGAMFGHTWLTPLVFIAAGLVLGFIFEKIILARMHKIAERTAWRGDDIIIAGIRGIPTQWFLLLGLYGALLNVSLPAHIHLVGRKLLLVIFVISATLAVGKIVAGLVTQTGVGDAGKNIRTASILRIVARIVVFSIGLLIVLQSLGISITPILTALGVGGLAVALALQPTLANLFAGIQIIAAREIVPGDFVKLPSGEDGYVEDITWRNTTIRQLSNNLIIVPNDNLAKSIVIDYYSPTREMSVVIPVQVAYRSDLETVERVTVEVAGDVQKTIPGAVREHQPFIRYNEFADDGIKLSVILRVSEFTDQYLVKHEFIKALYARYAREGINIPFPQRDVHITGEK